MTPPTNAGTPQPATVTATRGVNVRQAASASALKVTSWLPGVHVSAYPASAITLGTFVWIYLVGPGGEGWAVQGTIDGETYVMLDNTPEPLPSEEPPEIEPPDTNEPALYSLAMSADEVQQMAELFSQLSATALLLSQIAWTLYSRTGTDVPKGT